MMDGPLLDVHDLAVGYGRGDIVKDVSLTMTADEVVTVIGPNGAGKSTLIKAIAGVLRPRAGRVRVGGTDLTGRPASYVARYGLAYVPQEANVFRSLTVAENLAMGAWLAPSVARERRERVYTLFPVLRTRAGVRAGKLSGGERQMAALGMALMLAPRVLVLDEPSAGLAPAMVDQMLDTVSTVNATGIAVLMVEQNAVRALQLSHRGIVLAGGEKRLDAPAQELLTRRDVGDLYLGTGDAA